MGSHVQHNSIFVLWGSCNEGLYEVKQFLLGISVTIVEFNAITITDAYFRSIVNLAYTPVVARCVKCNNIIRISHRETD
jgi:hypothetical protein